MRAVILFAVIVFRPTVMTDSVQVDRQHSMKSVSFCSRLAILY